MQGRTAEPALIRGLVRDNGRCPHWDRANARRASGAALREDLAMATGALAYLGVCAVVICTPGPDRALTIRNSIIGGPRGGVLTAAGIALGQLVWTIAASIGIAGLSIQASQPAFTNPPRSLERRTWCSLGCNRSWPQSAVVPTMKGGMARRPSSNRCAQCVRDSISNIANPKMAAFFLSLLPQFVPLAAGSFVALLPHGLVFCLMTYAFEPALALCRCAASSGRS